MRFLPWPLIFLLFRFSLATPRNFTIDDTWGDVAVPGRQIIYQPSDSWTMSSSCTGCSAVPDPSQTFNRTWHSGTYSPKNSSSISVATVQFSGTAVYIYCILSLSPSSPQSDMTFIIDNIPLGTFKRSPGTTSGFAYNYLVFQTTNLSAETHTLTIQNGHTGEDSALILLDYILYTSDDTPSPNKTGSVSTPTTTTQKASTADVVGGVLGSLFALLLIALLFIIYRRHSRGEPLDFSRFFTPITRLFDNTRPLPSHTRSHTRKKSEPSFNPHLLVAKLVNKATGTGSAPRPPPKPRPVLPADTSTELPYMMDIQRSAVNSPAPLLASAQSPGTASPHLSGVSQYSARMESIRAWQRRTMEETRGVPPRPTTIDFSEQLSSYYDDATSEGARVKTPPPPPRHFTIMNN